MRTYLFLFLIVSTLGIGGVFFANYFCDPFFLKKSPSLLTYRYMPDERQNKTNLLINDAPKFDALVLGSSRTSYIWSHSFRKSAIFNYSSSSLYPSEYIGFIKTAYNVTPFKKLYVGLDFFGTHNTKHPQAKFVDVYVPAAQKFFAQRLDSSGITLSLKNAYRQNSYHEHYDNTLNKVFVRPQEPAFYKDCLYLLKQYRETLYNPQKYIFNPELKTIFKEIAAFCKSHAIELKVFTTPESAPLFSLMVKEGFLPYYERWIREAVQEFGAVYDFMGLTEITQNLNNYADTHHFSPSIGHVIAAILEGRKSFETNLGKLVTAENLESHLQNIRDQAKKADPDPIQTFEKLTSAKRS